MGGTSNSGISGDKTQPSWGVYDYWVVKIDSLGIKQWDKRFGGTGEDEGIGYISQTIDGGFLLSGDSYSPISGDKTENNLGPEQTWVIKTDALGNKQWDKTVFTNGHDEGGLAIKTKDGCFALANYTYAGIGGDKTQASQGSWDYWIIKFCDTTSAIIPTVNLSASDTILCDKQSINFFDLSLNNPTSWQWYFPGAQPDTSTLQNPTGIYYPSYGQFDVSLKACNAGGCDSLYFPNFITELQSPPAPVVTANGSMMCSSPAFSYAWYETANLTLLLSSNQCYQPTLPGNYFVIIADSNGCSKPSATIAITAMQNEINNACILTYNGSQLLVQGNCITDSESYVYIYDAQGKQIYATQLSSSSVNLPLTNNGIYFYRVVSHGVTSQGKFSFQNRMD
ncbi:MAG: T9SS type A sorting domain-containing protein [Bacteroidetes bacterium]|nr:T9SS type A sorting domain-containing protein [Bacteroidota bacterium]